MPSIWDRPSFMGGATGRGVALPGQAQPPPMTPPGIFPPGRGEAWGSPPMPSLPGIPGTGATRPTSRPATPGIGGLRPTSRPATPAQPPAPGQGFGGFGGSPPLGLTEALYNWINSPGANLQSFQGMFGNNSTSQIQDLWNQGINFSGNAGSLPVFDPNLQGGWSQQAGTGQWVYTAPGTGQGDQFYRQQAPPQGSQMGYQPPNPTGGYGQGGGYNPGAYGGGIRSQYGNSSQRAIDPRLLALLQQLLGGYGGGY